MKLVNNLYGYPEQGVLDANTYLIKGNPGIIVDPGNVQYVKSLVSLIEADGIDPRDIGIILNTHMHIDHSSANESFKALSGAKITLHPVQKQHYHLVVVEGTRDLGTDPVEFKEDTLIENNAVKTPEIEIGCIPSPGHSPDSVCFYLKNEKILICGDVLFAMNTGRVDLPGGDADTLKNSIEALAKMDIELLLPGHMNGVGGADNVRRNFEYVRQNVFPWL